MKKILVVLLVLAVAGGVFAQSSNWSMAAGVGIGTRIDFDPRQGGAPQDNLKLLDLDVNGKPQHVATANGVTYNWWDKTKVKAVLNYAGAGYVVGLEMDTRHDNEFYVSFARPTFKAKGAVWGLEDIFWQSKDGMNGGGGPFDGNGTLAKENNSIKRLYGEYYMLDGMVTLEVAYRSDDDGGSGGKWSSDTTGAFYHTFGTPAGTWLAESEHWHNWHYKAHGFFDNRETFTRVDGDTFIRTNLSFSGFDFGLMIPYLFADGYNGTNKGAVNAREASGGQRFVEDVLKQSVFGAKINLHPIEFAAQFKFQDYGVYFGGKFFLGPVSIGASFMGIMNPDPEKNADKRMKVGGTIAYDAGAMGAGVKAYLERNNGPTAKDAEGYINGYNQTVAFMPYFFFKVIPSHLGFKLDAGFYFTKTVEGKNEVTDMYWAVQPMLCWNFNGTGAWTGYAWASGAGSGTGMYMRYRMISNTMSALDLIFQFHM
jgi:hypothetical protein